MWFNSSPNDKILDWSNLKAFADDTINVTEILKSFLGSLENIVGKRENDGKQYFTFSRKVFIRYLLQVVLSPDFVGKS